MTESNLRLLRPASVPVPRRVLLLHGLGAGDNIWHLYRALAGPDLELWGVRLPWRFDGETDWAYDPGCFRVVADVLGESFDAVVAHSFAANVLLELLATQRHPQPEATVLLAPFYRPRPGAFHWDTAEYYLNEFQRFLESGIAARRLMRGRSRLDGAVLNDMGRHVRDRIGAYGWLRFFETYLRTPWLRLDQVRGPCLVVAGERDTAASPRDAGDLAAALPGSRLTVLPDTGHFAMVEAAAPFAAALDAFFHQTLNTRPLHAVPDVRAAALAVPPTYPEELLT
ncbi:alpha/beta fold hydrolase [Streptomyces sp. NPDC007991]|uniref:alpha/beta fold hydrolase n=1 Tax=Streptomyces sp. NPDC007991 TaxID=3364803 RepID=UPI0036E00D48